MRTRWWRTAALGLALVSCGLGDIGPLPSTSPGTSADTVGEGTLARPRIGLPAVGPPRYERDKWQPHGWADADGDGCNTREEVLLVEGTDVRTGPGCKILAGVWTDPFSGLQVTSPARLQIDHLVALGDAHASGGWAWTVERKVAFANDLDDPDELNAVAGALNQAKADHGPDRWLPPDRAAQCWYIRAYAGIKARWDLTVTPAQWAAIEAVRAGCAGSTAVEAQV